VEISERLQSHSEDHDGGPFELGSGYRFTTYVETRKSLSRGATVLEEPGMQVQTRGDFESEKSSTAVMAKP
jgi:hypothetical protein